MRKACVALLFGFFAAACGGGEGGGNNITGPSNRIPTVTGNYSGTTSITFPEVPRTVTCPTTTSVTQSGATVSIAPLQLTGACGTLSLPFGQTAIDATGAIAAESGTFNEPSCGVYNYTASGGFFGRDLRLSMVATSRTCLNMNITINLTRP